MNAEQKRLSAQSYDANPWRRWGPYLSERQWGTVREDYSDTGSAWDYFTHDQARSRAYRRGEDGIAGISDFDQLLCFSLAMWNGKDSILKERLFGLTNSEGNHGEDVKEYYFYLDSTPTHSYLKYLYKYPQAAFPYSKLVETNRNRSKNEPEYELLDTGIFDEDRYFDVFVEYAKASPDDLLIRISVHNRGPEAAQLHLLPTLWFRNTWGDEAALDRPRLQQFSHGRGLRGIEARHPLLGNLFLYCEEGGEYLFTENETNTQKLFQAPNKTPYVKDGINDYLIEKQVHAVNPEHTGTKASPHYNVEVAPGTSWVLKLRLSDIQPDQLKKPLEGEFESIFAQRIKEADEFFASITPEQLNADQALVYRQALAGMLWSKQFYNFDLHQWLHEMGADPLVDSPKPARNKEWFHMVNRNIISMPDKWEYPWYAAWDLAFHAVALSTVDPEFAKNQLEITLSEKYLHPNGQIPAYEWNFSDVNPPVHAWASIFIHRTEQLLHGRSEVEFLGRIFSKLLLNFTWWVNRKDRLGKNVFEGGFLGLDNIGVFDRSAPLPTGGYLEQADGTAWMAFYSQCMGEIAVELTKVNPDYEPMCQKFADHFLLIAWGMNRPGSVGLWDEEDGFYYDVLRLPDGSATRLKVRSLVGLLPLCATTTFEAADREHLPNVTRSLNERLRSMPQLASCTHPLGENHRGVNDRSLTALVDEKKLRRILGRMLDEKEFLSPYGVRSLSLHHRDHPYIFRVGNDEYRVDYQPAESNTGAFGGNSNWRGPVWMPINVLLIRALLQFYLYYGDSLQVEFPTGSGTRLNLFEVARELANRLTRVFLCNHDGQRPVFGASAKFQNDPHFRDHILFYEYFHGDTGAGVGASHQTGWTGMVAKLMEMFCKIDGKKILEGGLGKPLASS